MKAIRVNEWGAPVQYEDIPRPEPADDEVLVKVHAASVNPVDSVIQAGYMEGWVHAPLTLGPISRAKSSPSAGTSAT